MNRRAKTLGDVPGAQYLLIRRLYPSAAEIDAKHEAKLELNRSRLRNAYRAAWFRLWAGLTIAGAILAHFLRNQ